MKERNTILLTLCITALRKTDERNSGQGWRAQGGSQKGLRCREMCFGKSRCKVGKPQTRAVASVGIAWAGAGFASY